MFLGLSVPKLQTILTKNDHVWVLTINSSLNTYNANGMIHSHCHSFELDSCHGRPLQFLRYSVRSRSFISSFSLKMSQHTINVFLMLFEGKRATSTLKLKTCITLLKFSYCMKWDFMCFLILKNIWRTFYNMKGIAQFTQSIFRNWGFHLL